MSVAAFLTDRDIEADAVLGRPLVAPFDPAAVQAASIDLCLSGEYYKYNLDAYILGEAIPDDRFEKGVFEHLTVRSQETAHVGIAGKISIPDDVLGFVFARSSITRIGLRIAPVFMNPGYSGLIPIAVTNCANFPITLVKGARFAQLVCARLAARPERTYSDRAGKYVGEELSGTRLHSDADIKAALDRVLSNYFASGVATSAT